MLKHLAILSALTMSAPTFAAIQTWDWNSTANPIIGGSTYGNSISATSGDVSVTVTAWSDTGGTNDDEVQSARLVYYSSEGGSLGAINREESSYSPDHSIDNITDTGTRDSDMVLLEFTTEVNLTHVDIGWGTDDGGSGNDGQADMSVAAITSNNLDGNTWSQILAGGTSASNSYSNIQTSSPDYQAISGFADVFSKYWLVGAYNSTFGFLHNYYNDGIKLDGIKTLTNDITTNQVPIPSSLLLLLIGLLVMHSYRDQKQRSEDNVVAIRL